MDVGSVMSPKFLHFDFLVILSQKSPYLYDRMAHF